MDEMQRTLLGIKLKQLRQQKGYSFQELSKKTGISVSYLNEIEKGKKRPKEEKLFLLEQHLEVKRGYLTEERVNTFLQPLTNLLNSGFLRDLPLETFGISQAKVVQAIAEAPLQIGAFIQTLLDFTEQQQQHGENFYKAALRTYKSLNKFTFESAERSAQEWYNEEYAGLKGSLKKLKWLEHHLSKDFNWKMAFMYKDSNLPDFRLPCYQNAETGIVYLNENLSPAQKVYRLNMLRAYLAMGLKVPEVPVEYSHKMNFEAALHDWAAKIWVEATMLPLSKIEELVNGLAHEPITSLRKVQQLANLAVHDFKIHLERIAGVIYNNLKIRDISLVVFEHNSTSNHHRCIDELYTRPPRKKMIPDANEMYCGFHPGLQISNLYFKGEIPAGRVWIRKAQFKHWNKTYLTMNMVIDTGDPSVCRTYSLGMNVRHLTELDLKAMEQTQCFRTCERCNFAACELRRAPATIFEKQKSLFQLQDQIKTLRNLSQPS